MLGVTPSRTGWERVSTVGAAWGSLQQERADAGAQEGMRSTALPGLPSGARGAQGAQGCAPAPAAAAAPPAVAGADERRGEK